MSKTTPLHNDIEADPALVAVEPAIGVPVATFEASTGDPVSKALPAKTILSLLALFATLFISALNATIVATAVPTIVHEFEAPSGYAWIAAAYLLGNTASSPIWAKLSDIWGRKPIILSAVAGYAVFSMMCALSTSVGMLIAGRALQGVAGGGLSQLVVIVISDMFSVRRRGFYLGLTEIVWTLASGTGPVLGGAFSQHVSWRWVFWISLPISCLAFVLLLLFLDVHNPRTALVPGLKAIDWAGSITILGLLVMFLLGLNFGGAEYSWNSPTVICLIVFGLAMIGIFVLCEQKVSRYPLIPMSIFQSKSNIAILFVAFAQSFTLITIEFYFPLFFQSVRGASPTESGVLILPATLTTCLSAFLTGVYMTRMGRYVDLLYGGTILTALTYGLLMIWSPNSSLGLIIGFQIIAGWGAGALITPPFVALQATVPQSMTATSTATLGLVKYIANVISVVLGNVVFQIGMDMGHGELLAGGISPSSAAQFGGKTAAANLNLIDGIEDPEQQFLIRAVFSEAIRNIWILNLTVAAVAIVASLFIKQRKLSDEHVEARTGIDEKSAETIIEN